MDNTRPILLELISAANAVDYTRLTHSIMLMMHQKRRSLALRCSLIRLCFAAFVLMGLLSQASCVPPNATQSLIEISITVEGLTQQQTIPPGTTVQTAVEKAGISLNPLDRTDPPTYSVLTDKSHIQIVRVRETFDVQEVIIPYKQQLVRNEALPEGETRLIQPGINGLEEITTRHVFEDNLEVSSQVAKTTVVKEPVSEIVMVGVQTPFATLPIPGILVYLTGGNAWTMKGSTGNRRPLTTTGDLDSRVFSASPDGKWLLVTRKTKESSADVLNTLWVINLEDENPTPIDLNVSNIVHYAGWVPGSPMTIAYSTVEPRSDPPGWQANNDLRMLTFNAQGVTSQRREVVETNSGGIYGWWGTSYAWSRDGKQLAYARPDAIGLVKLTSGELLPSIDIIPFQTHGSWAWIPGLSWGADGESLFTVNHVPLDGTISAEDSPDFDLTAVLFEENRAFSIFSQSGMFAYPKTSPWISENRYKIGFLQAVFPDQSESSTYRLVVMDQDGSNKETVFPAPGLVGLDPQEIIWSPAPLGDTGLFIALTYQGNLWLIDEHGQHTHQLTGDGLTTRIDWH